MEIKAMLEELVKLANDLDEKGLMKEADALDEVIFKLANERDNWLAARNKVVQFNSTSLLDWETGCHYKGFEKEGLQKVEKKDFSNK